MRLREGFRRGRVLPDAPANTVNSSHKTWAVPPNIGVVVVGFLVNSSGKKTGETKEP